MWVCQGPWDFNLLLWECVLQLSLRVLKTWLPISQLCCCSMLIALRFWTWMNWGKWQLTREGGEGREWEEGGKQKWEGSQPDSLTEKILWVTLWGQGWVSRVWGETPFSVRCSSAKEGAEAGSLLRWVFPPQVGFSVASGWNVFSLPPPPPVCVCVCLVVQEWNLWTDNK